MRPTLCAFFPLALLLACGGPPATTGESDTDAGTDASTTGDAGTATMTGSTTTTTTSGSGSTSSGSSGDPSGDPTADATSGTTSAESTTTTTTTTTTGVVDPCDPNPCEQPPPYCEGNVQFQPVQECVGEGERFSCVDGETVMTACGELDPVQACLDGVCAPPLMPAPGEVIFVELMQDPVELSDHDAEWFELKNLGPLPVDLDGCRLVDLGVNMDDHLLDAGGPLVIQPGALMVMAKSVDPLVNGGIDGVAHAFGDAFSLTNPADAAVLRCDDVDIDVVAYESDGWPFTGGQAMGLDPGQEEATANDFAAAWCGATEEYTAMNAGSPGAANPACG